MGDENNNLHSAIGELRGRVSALEKTQDENSQDLKEIREQISEMKVFLAKLMGAGFVLMTVGGPIISALIKKLVP